jgi:peptidoglycan/LPS O-acetylase OafA/YrhL
MSETGESSPTRFRELDALRGFAAVGVVIFHYFALASRYWMFPFEFEIGNYGFQLFFVVSGFVIFWTLSRSSNLIDFTVSRFSRLYPTYWCALTLLSFRCSTSGCCSLVFRGQHSDGLAHQIG